MYIYVHTWDDNDYMVEMEAATLLTRMVMMMNS